MGEGGLLEDGTGKLNAMQLLHGAYTIQNWCEHDELKQIYLFTQTQLGVAMKFKKLEDPIATRWWLAGTCTCLFLVSLPVWEQICNGIRKSAPSNSAAYKVAASILGVIKEPMILSNVRLLATLHTWFLFVHFDWCQKGNPEAGDTPSFQSWHMLVRFFLMLQQVEDAMEEKWMLYA